MDWTVRYLLVIVVVVVVLVVVSNWPYRNTGRKVRKYIPNFSNELDVATSPAIENR